MRTEKCFVCGVYEVEASHRVEDVFSQMQEVVVSHRAPTEAPGKKRELKARAKAHSSHSSSRSESGTRALPTKPVTPKQLQIVRHSDGLSSESDQASPVHKRPQDERLSSSSDSEPQARSNDPSETFEAAAKQPEFKSESEKAEFSAGPDETYFLPGLSPDGENSQEIE